MDKFSEEKRNKNIAIILASGSSERLSNISTLKQFVKIAGKSVIEHTLDVFEKNPNIDEIIIVTRDDCKEYCKDILDKNNYKKVVNILSGGKTRQESSFIGLNSITYGDKTNVLIHDAVRPFISDRIIEECINALDKYQAVDVAIPSADTIIQVDDSNLITDIPKRKYLRRGQTPQAFKLGVIKKAHHLAQNDTNIEVTDDCGLIIKYNLCDVYVVNGDDFNIKITYPIDIDIADKLFQIRSFDSSFTTPEKLKDKVIVVFGASRGIGEEIVSIAKNNRARVYGFSRATGIDITDFKLVDQSLKEVYEKENRIDAVINTAGVLRKGSIEERNLEEIIDDIKINYVGNINIAKASINYLKKSKGSLILFGSSSYTRGRANSAVYSSSKAAVINLTQALAEEWEEYGVRVNVINPARTKTPMRYENFGEEPEGTLLSPKKVAEQALNTLLSNCTGQVVNIRVK